MKKFIILFFPILSYSNTTNIIDKIVYNGKENPIEVRLSSNLKENTALDVSEIDTLVENFKFARNNDLKVNIEPSKERNHVNLVITNKKKNPFSASFGVDNHGASEEDGKYRYTINLGTSGLLLNENINFSYTFVRPINPKRREVKELKPGEFAKPPKPDELKKARKNNNITLELSYPLKNVKSYITYSYRDYKKSIIGNNDIYDVSGNSHRIGIKLESLIYRNKKKKLNLISSYSHIKRKSYLEDTLISENNIDEVDMGMQYSEDLSKFESICSYKIEDGEVSFSADNSLNLKKKFKNEIEIGLNLSNHLEKDNSNLIIIGSSSYKIVNVDVGINANSKGSNPILKLGLKKDIWKFSIDTSLNYDTSFRWLFDIRFNIQ